MTKRGIKFQNGRKNKMFSQKDKNLWILICLIGLIITTIFHKCEIHEIQKNQYQCQNVNE